MAEIKSIDVKEEGILLNLKISDKEYRTIKSATKDLLIFPTDSLDETLTTGKLGNSNRIMLPKKVLERNSILKLHKKVAAKIFEMDNDKFLVIMLEEKKVGIPVFKEEIE